MNIFPKLRILTFFRILRWNYYISIIVLFLSVPLILFCIIHIHLCWNLNSLKLISFLRFMQNNKKQKRNAMKVAFLKGYFLQLCAVQSVSCQKLLHDPLLFMGAGSDKVLNDVSIPSYTFLITFSINNFFCHEVFSKLLTY